MQPPLTPSAAVRVAYVFVTVLLLGAAAVGVLAIVSGGVAVARDGDSLLYGDTLTVPVQLSPEEVGPLPAGLRVNSWLDASVEVRNPTVEQALLRTAADIVPLALFIPAAWLARGLLRDVLRGDPFGPGNVRRLRRLGVLLAAGGPLAQMAGYTVRNGLFETLPSLTPANVGVGPFALPGGFLVAGLAAFVLAAIFAHGARLRDDVEGTI